jgi:hypothetical protein
MIPEVGHADAIGDTQGGDANVLGPMKRIFPLIVFMSVLMVSQSAIAAPIILFDAERRAGVNGSGTFTDELGVWSYSQTGTNASGTASVFHDTNLSAGFIGGTASGTAQSHDFGNVGAGTQLFVDFTLGQSFMADLDLLLSAADGGYAAVGLKHRIDGLDYDLVRHFVRNDTEQIDYTAILEPGWYRFFLDAQAGATFARFTSADASFNGGLTLTPIGPPPVPEPASMLLLGSGLAAIAAKRYRRRKR